MKFGDDLKLKRVIIGPEHPSRSKKNYVQTAKYITDLVKQAGAELIVARAEFGTYKVRRVELGRPDFKNC